MVEPSDKFVSINFNGVKYGWFYIFKFTSIKRKV
jgi:hypothetical protein